MMEISRAEKIAAGALTSIALAVGGFALETGRRHDALLEGMPTCQDVADLVNSPGLYRDQIIVITQQTPRCKDGDQIVARGGGQG